MPRQKVTINLSLKTLKKKQFNQSQNLEEDSLVTSLARDKQL